MPAPTATPTSHRERLRAPVAWWLVALAFTSTLVIAVAAYTAPWFGAAAAVACLVVVCGSLWAWGHVPVAVDASGVTAGRSHVEWRWVADVEPLDAAGLRAVMGPGALATAYCLLRPYVHKAVKVTLDDPADPHPYWVVATRHPRRFASVAGTHLAAKR